jgi:hypothetical protein
MMQFLTRLTAVAVAALPFVAQTAPITSSKFAAIPGKYIVQLRPDVDVASIAAHHAQVRSIHARNVNTLTRRDLAEAESIGLEHEYGFGEFHGYSGGFDAATVEELKALPEVSHLIAAICRSLTMRRLSTHVN